MTSVSVARAHGLPPQSYWEASLGDLIVEVGSPAVRDFKVDAIFAASMHGQSDAASIVADRLGLRPDIALTIDAADASGAAALKAGFAHIKAGLSRTALVIGAAKISDLPEDQRLSLMDCTLDRGAAGGIDYATQVGLIAGLALTKRGLDATAFLELTAANHAAWARQGGRTAPSLAEFKRDLVAAPPLVRSDFAQLQDGACAVILTSEKCDSPFVISAMGQATDIVSPWERTNPIEFSAVGRALAALGKPALAGGHLEVDCAASPIEYLVRDAVARFGNAHDPARVLSHDHNIRGGSQGRGRVLGASTLYQLSDLLESPPNPRGNLLLAVAGIGHHIVSAHFAGEGPK